MKKSYILAIVLVVIVLFGMFTVGAYNSLITVKEEVNTAWGQVQTQLQRRGDLIPNLVETVKGYASQEKEIFTAVAEARAKLIGAKTPTDSANANGELSGALSRLLAISEAYPQLKSDANFRQLQDELAGTENRIARSREEYNTVVKQYNKMVKTIPTVIFAKFMNFDEIPYFEAEEGKTQVPNAKF